MALLLKNFLRCDGGMESARTVRDGEAEGRRQPAPGLNTPAAETGTAREGRPSSCFVKAQTHAALSLCGVRVEAPLEGLMGENPAPEAKRRCEHGFWVHARPLEMAAIGISAFATGGLQGFQV